MSSSSPATVRPGRALVVLVESPRDWTASTSMALNLLFSMGSSGYAVTDTAAGGSLSSSAIGPARRAAAQGKPHPTPLPPAPAELQTFAQLLGALPSSFIERRAAHRSVKADISPVAQLPDAFADLELGLVSTSSAACALLHGPGGAAPASFPSTAFPSAFSASSSSAASAASSSSSSPSSADCSRYTTSSPVVCLAGGQRRPSSLAHHALHMLSPGAYAEGIAPPRLVVLHIAPGDAFNATRGDGSAANAPSHVTPTTSTSLSVLDTADRALRVLLPALYSRAVCCSPDEQTLWALMTAGARDPEESGTDVAGEAGPGASGSILADLRAAMARDAGRGFDGVMISVVVRGPDHCRPIVGPGFAFPPIAPPGSAPAAPSIPAVFVPSLAASSARERGYWFPRQSYEFVQGIDVATPLPTTSTSALTGPVWAWLPIVSFYPGLTRRSSKKINDEDNSMLINNIFPTAFLQVDSAVVPAATAGPGQSTSRQQHPFRGQAGTCNILHVLPDILSKLGVNGKYGA